MLQHISEHIRHCHARAEEARQRAAETSDPERKADYELAEQSWLRLADSYALSERLERYLLEQDSKMARRREWQPAATAPFDRDLEVAVIKGVTPHAVAFPCRRVLHGWVVAETRKPIMVEPTHWREWEDRSPGNMAGGDRREATPGGESNGQPRREKSEEPVRLADLPRRSRRSRKPE